MNNIPNTLKEALGTRLGLVNTALNEFIQRLEREVNQEDIYTRAAIQSYLSLLSRGGKRIRGVLTLIGYELYNGQHKKEVAVRAAVAIEAYHAYLLVMDDVADNSDQRRGGPAAHIQMRDFIKRHSRSTNEAEKKGIDLAQSAALYGQHRAQSIILQLEQVSYQHRVLATDIINARLARTGIGQLHDMAPLHDLTLDDILQIATDKTAYYTFLLPLQVGAILAGAPQSELELFEPYSLNAGLAFQLHDDILGTFGNDTVTGKPIMSDIMEGKKTVLIAKTLEKASQENQKKLLAALGNPSLSQTTFRECLAIIKDCGALDDAHDLAAKYANKSIHALETVPPHWDKAAVQFLRDLATYSIKRTT